MIPGFLLAYFAAQGEAPVPTITVGEIYRHDVFFNMVIDKGETIFFNTPFVDPNTDGIRTLQIVDFDFTDGSLAPAFRNSLIFDSAEPFVTFGHLQNHVPINHNKPPTLVLIDSKNLFSNQSQIAANNLVVYFFDADGTVAPAFRNSVVESQDPFITFNPYTADTYSNVLDSVDLEPTDYSSLSVSFDPNANP